MDSITLSHVNSTFLDMEIMFTKVDVNFKRWFFIFQSTHVDEMKITLKKWKVAFVQVHEHKSHVIHYFSLTVQGNVNQQ